MNILDILVTQRKLKRIEQLNSLIETIKNNGYVEPIEILQDSSGRYILENGTHRTAAYFLAGKEKLEDYEYNLLYADSERPTFGNIKNLIDRSK